MTISTEFETIIVCKPILELRFKGGWKTWLKKFSMEDDGELSRVSAMSGHDISYLEKKIQKLGLLPPNISEDKFHYRDYFIYSLEYKPHRLRGFQSFTIPDWLIWNEPLMNKMSLFEIDKLPLGSLKTHPARPTFDFNKKAVIR